MDGGTINEGAMANTFNPLTDQRAFRDALGQFATGVTVITCDSPDGPLGITANSFASVSLDPALVLWSPAKTSTRYDGFMQARHFAIHMLRDDQLALGARFARDGADFSHCDWACGAEGHPVLSDCLARFDCERVAAHDAGDHTILIGQVLRAQTNLGQPLIFAQGKYGGFDTKALQT